MKFIINIAFCLMFPVILLGQVDITRNTHFSNNKKSVNSLSNEEIRVVENELEWIGVRTASVGGVDEFEYISFQGANHRFSVTKLPYFEKKRKVNGNPNVVIVEVINPTYEVLTNAEILVVKGEELGEEIQVEVNNIEIKKQHYLQCQFVPIIKRDGQYLKLVSFDLEWDISQMKTENSQTSIFSYADNSVLSSGNWYKLGVLKDGVHKLSYSKLKSMGVDVDNVDPRKIQLYGNGGGMLPMNNYEFRYDDLEENSIMVIGESDGVFNQGDYVLFYGESQDQLNKNGATIFKHEKNLFCDTTFYFLTVDQSFGKRIVSKAIETSYDIEVTSFNEHIFHEKDRVNLIKTGQDWYGEQFGVVNVYDYSFNLPNLDNTAPVRVECDFASHSEQTSSTFLININGESWQYSDQTVSAGYTATYADKTNAVMELANPSSVLNVEIAFNKGNSTSQAWLNYISINARRKLKMQGNQMHFRDLNSVTVGSNALFKIENMPSNATIWDVTNTIDPMTQPYAINGSQGEFISSVTNLREFVVFDGNFFEEPLYLGKVKEQNLHALKNLHPDYIIVTHPKFETEALELASFHENEEGFVSVVATTRQIYNEFSSGAQDINAIRSFVKMFYDEAAIEDEMPRYLLLFGDGSYDYKNRISGNSNYVPVYQSQSSFNPTTSFCSDDFYGLLDDSEGQANNQYIDIGIGRLPVRTKQEAKDQVNKIKRYYSSNTLQPWRNWLLFIGDDEDNDVHMADANRIANRAAQVNSDMNIDKIFLDAYPQVSGAGGERYPAAKEDFDKRIEQGALVVSYMGHGGELGWAHERILEVPQINAWSNEYKMPLFLTATCEFSRYDDPQRTSAGEYVLLNPAGGAIALLTTTRLVYSSGNYSLMDNFFEFGFAYLDSGLTTLGDLVEATKIHTSSDENSRKFNLLGDPALALALPKYSVITTDLPDTMKALDKVTITGYIADDSGQKLESFNGVVYPYVFDKSKRIKTLNNDNPNDTSFFRFDLQINLIFKGKASVTNGDFQFTFVVPKDISLEYGAGRISYYAENGIEDGNGNTTEFLLGGYNPNAADDDDGPELELYMNDESFVFGGITDENPEMLANVFDEHGINTSGNGVGHDILAVLDQNTSNAIVLNDYYEAELDNYQKGTINYPFSNLDEGQHTLSLKVWDVYNNSSETNTEFVVAESAQLALDHVLNYPNPFTTNTAFYFEHNQPGQGLEVRIEIFTVSGKLIKTIDSFISGNSYRVGPIYWDGLDDFGDPIGKGVYVYKLSVGVSSGETIDHFEKLVILN